MSMSYHGKANQKINKKCSFQFKLIELMIDSLCNALIYLYQIDNALIYWMFKLINCMKQDTLYRKVYRVLRLYNQTQHITEKPYWLWNF